MIRTVASLGGIVVAFALVLYLTYDDGGGDGGSSRNPTPAPSRAAAASPMRTGQPEDSAADAVLAQGEPIEFPEDVALIVGQTCKECEHGAYSRIYRAYRDTRGGVRMDRLFPPPGRGGPTVTSLAVSWDGRLIALTACRYRRSETMRTCESDQTLYRSKDGGVTWEDWSKIDGNAFVARVQHVVASEGIEFDEAIIGQHPASPDGEYSFTAYSGEPTSSWVPIPDATFYGVVPGAGPVWHSLPGEIASENLLLDVDNQLLARFEDSISLRLLSKAYLRAEEAKTFAKTEPGRINEIEYFLEISEPLEEDGAVYSWSAPITVSGQVGLSQVVGNAEIDPALAALPDGFWPYNVPVVIDVVRQIVNPISRPFFTPALLQYRYDVLMVQDEGPFARGSIAGDCLNLRAQPDHTAEVVDCISPRVLLTNLKVTKEVGGTLWLAVMSPDGTTGWADTEYLEY